MVNLPSVEEMLKAGMHFGHRTNRWHPKMKPYIFTDKKGVYIIDLNKSREKLAEAMEFMSQLISEGKVSRIKGCLGKRNEVGQR